MKLERIFPVCIDRCSDKAHSEDMTNTDAIVILPNGLQGIRCPWCSTGIATDDFCPDCGEDVEDYRDEVMASEW